MQLESDPICSSAGCDMSTGAKKAKDAVVHYPNPEEQGLDSDIKHSIKSEADTSTKLGHSWNIFKEWGISLLLFKYSPILHFSIL